MKYGIGQWTTILNTGLLPGKAIIQLNNQTQRLLGQQSLAGKVLSTVSGWRDEHGWLILG